MSVHEFGGRWTALKLQVLREYLHFFATALGGKFKLVYIDTFAGSGKCTIKVGKDGQQTIDGSATIALDVSKPFDEYFFIERRGKHVKALEALKATHREGHRIHITRGDAREHLADLLKRQQWSSTRGVLFLDPYGLQCTWQMVLDVAATKALDVLFLVSVSGLSRQAATSASRIDEDKSRALDAFLGTNDWRTALYKRPPTREMFDDDSRLNRDTGIEAIMQFVQWRMEEAFPHVEAPLILRGPSNAPLYALYFAVSNPQPKAKALAGKVSREILSKLR
jgi:three-Cys-motif partner protein